MILKNINILFAVIVSFSFVFVSCKKKEVLTYVIEGRVFDPNYSNYVSDVTVKIFAKEISGGTLNGNYALISSVKSGLDGNYILEFDRTNVVDYKMVFERNNYFSNEEIFNQGKLSIKENNNMDIKLYPKAFLKIHIVNSNPINEYDQFDLYFDKSTSYSCSNCCGNQRHIISGENIDTTIICSDWANKELLMQYNVVKSGNVSTKNRSVFTNIGDTSVVNIFY